MKNKASIMKINALFFRQYLKVSIGFLMCENEPEIIVYGTTWCGDTIRARNFLDKNNISYKWIDIDKDITGRIFVEKTNNGNRSVPTIVFPDGSILVEPSNAELSEKIKK